MNFRRVILVLMSLGTACLTAFSADPFDSASNGSYGAITQGGTLDMPPDGIFHCTTITIPSGHGLSFRRNGLNTPVYLLATGDVVIDGEINVSADQTYATGRLGGPGGFDGGYGGSVYAGYQSGGDGMGPGGAVRAEGKTCAAFGSSTYGCPSPPTYGNSILSPLIGGSGGAGYDYPSGEPGGGGGGAVLIASNTRIQISGAIKANGSGGWGGTAGSGGAIRLVAPVVSGTGSLQADGAGRANWGSGNGRIRIDCLDNKSFRQLRVGAVASRGSRMVVFPPIMPQLDIIEAAGLAILEGTNSTVQVDLPSGAPTNQTIRVQARNFTNDVPIRVVVTPENGRTAGYDATILQSSGNPPFANVPVIIPAGHIAHIQVWTR